MQLISIILEFKLLGCYIPANVLLKVDTNFDSEKVSWCLSII